MHFLKLCFYISSTPTTRTKKKTRKLEIFDQPGSKELRYIIIIILGY